MRFGADEPGSDEPPTAVFPAPAPASPAEVEHVAPVLAASDQCANCGAHLAPDQHYCLVCGERRGAPRFSSLPAVTADPPTTFLTEERLAPRPPRFSSAATLIAGVATLLIAMGIGVYIGGLGKGDNGGSGRAQIVTVNGGAAAAPAASGATTAAASGRSGGSHTKQRSGGTRKRSGGAARVVTTVKSLPPPTVTVGAKGSGKGYQHGHFTGHFFGP
ncbi:MAG TPA: hypothetical protein VFN55_16015 [Solirubrobacteraceae bacterium]|nr:hypothetical protein [Solirubrobacteraceae bacterium]